jgi:hypothetical protein
MVNRLQIIEEVGPMIGAIEEDRAVEIDVRHVTEIDGESLDPVLDPEIGREEHVMRKERSISHHVNHTNIGMYRQLAMNI